MEYHIALILALAFFVYSISFRQLEHAELTGPMYFVLVGAAIAAGVFSDFELDQPLHQLLPLVELTLAVFLFSDAAKTRLALLQREYMYPVVLLCIALPLTFLATWLTGWLLFPDIGLIGLTLVAIILTPTDAALSKGILASESVPATVRETINIESGLNDGLCVPLFMFLFLSWQPNEWQAPTKILEFVLREIGIAVIVATVITFTATRLIQVSLLRHYFDRNSSPFLILSLAIVNFSAAQSLGGSGFIAAFCAGLIFDRLYRPERDMKFIEESENTADFFAYLIWCLFGAYTFWQIQAIELSTAKIVFAVVAATLVRVIPVMLVLTPFKNLRLRDKFTIAWFGPRGLASIVFTLMVIDSADGLISELATLTILASVFIHGVTTRPIVRLYEQGTPETT